MFRLWHHLWLALTFVFLAAAIVPPLCRAAEMRYDPKRNVLRPTTLGSETRQDTDVVDTAWMADVSTGRSRMIVGPMGDLKKMWKTGQLGGSSVYEPMFSPDGQSVWFVNQGSPYQVIITASQLTASGARLVAKLGELDFWSIEVGERNSGDGVGLETSPSHLLDRQVLGLGRVRVRLHQLAAGLLNRLVT